MTCAPCVRPDPMPLTTGRIGLSQTTGELQFYGHNRHGVGMGLFTGQWKWDCPPPCPPKWGPPQFRCQSWASGCCGGGCGGGCGCGCSGCCNPCLAGANCFAQLLTNIGPWLCYWQEQKLKTWLTVPGAWPTSQQAAQQQMQAT